MSLQTPYYFDGVELVYPFEEYGDTDNAWVKRIYLISQDYRHLRKRVGDVIDMACLQAHPDLQAKQPWLLETKSQGEAPNRVRVEELYGYLPDRVHHYPSQLNWVRPGVDGAAGETSYDLLFFSSNAQGGSATLSGAETFDVAVGTLVQLSCSGGGESQATNPARVTSVNAGHLQFSYTSAAQPNVPVFDQQGVRFFTGYMNLLGRVGAEEITLQLLVTGAGNRQPNAWNVPASVRRDYFRASAANAQYLPPIIHPWTPQTATGTSTQVLTTTTVPSIDDYVARAGELVSGAPSTVGKVAGDIYYRETPYVALF